MGDGEEGILVRFIDRGDLVVEDLYPADTPLWIREVSEIGSIGLPAILTEELRRFWYSQNEILYLTSEDNGKAHKAVKIVAERIKGRRSLFVFGAGHVGRSIALMGTMIGLEVTLIDDRQEFLAQERLPDCDICLLPVNFNQIENSIRLNRRSAVVIVTRGHQYDEVILRQVANQKAGYIGMIGSRRRVAGVFRRLRQEGVSELFLSSVKAPIGLDIGARSPQEIAVAVHAEIIRHFSSIDATDLSANL
jgi:xanthine/CO dehydrogenase XdhC/CoxF family maturation factor